jgi:hypothetical protein
MTYEKLTPLPPADILERARRFFAERVPQEAAYPDKRGDSWLTLRGQGGEEVAMAVFPHAAGSRIRASTLFFDQPLERFLATLPSVEVAA